jgi:hypothetical protein
LAQETSRSSASKLSLFFPHSGRGQSILIRVPPNSWIVVDVNKGSREQNATRDILRLYERQPGFQVLALVITHFHEDHYSGVTEILDFCKEVADRRDVALQAVVRRLILPCMYEDFRDFLSDLNYDGVKGHLEKLLRYVNELGELVVGILPAMQYAMGAPRQGAQAEEIWCFTFYPDTGALVKDFLAKLKKEPDLRARAALTRQLQEDANRYAYLLGIGCGESCGDLCFLLASDLPGSILGNITTHLRDRVLPDVLDGQFGAYGAIEPLIDRSAPTTPHLRPVSGLTVPHHGSGQEPMQQDDLSWWLGSWKPRTQPAFAVVQGGPYALRENTIEELAKARLRIFATSQPERLLDGNEACRSLPSTPRRRLGPIPVSPYRVVPKEAEEMEDDALPEDVSCLTIHGGSGGLHRVMARRMYEICLDQPTIIFHERTEIFPGRGAAAGWSV